VIREGRFTDAQKRAMEEHWPVYGIEADIPDGSDINQYFDQSQPLICDVGFGAGDSLISLAQQKPEYNFVGIEVYRPGIGAVLQKIHQLELSNIRVVNADAIDFIEKKVADNQLAGMMVWFPDPWPKQKHKKRRLVQKGFLEIVVKAMQADAILHLASDWQPYIKFMRSQVQLLPECLHAVEAEMHPLGLERPATRFEQRGLRKGHLVSDLFYQVTK
jgi:tRNA (guanine-N7-)-methyltransferase